MEKKQTKTSWNLINKSIFLLFMLLSLCSCSSGAVIHDHFKYCKTFDNKMILDLKDSCSSKNLIQNSPMTNMHIITQKSNIVNGKGHQCKMLKNEVITKMDFLGRGYILSQSVSTISLTREDCLDMVLTKRCNRAPMQCEGDYCEFSENPSLEYNYWSPYRAENFNCIINTIPFIAENENSQLLSITPIVTSAHQKTHSVNYKIVSLYGTRTSYTSALTTMSNQENFK